MNVIICKRMIILYLGLNILNLDYSFCPIKITEKNQINFILNLFNLITEIFKGLM